MAQEGSVAPKERVNIVYKPATGDAQEETELPFKLLVLSDFTLAPDERAVEDRDPISVDKDNFNDVLKAQNVKVDLTVDDKLSGEADAQMAVSLDFQSINDFNPDAIAQKVPELKKMLELRDALKAVKSPLSNIPAFRKKIQNLVDDPEAKAKLMKELGLDETPES